MNILTILVAAIAVVSAQIPHNAYIYIQTENGQPQPCRGSLIGINWVLTAASCFDNCVTSQVEVSLGSTKKTLYPIHTKSVKIIKHNGYRKETLENDIALIQIRAKVTFEEGINIIELPTLKPNNKTDLYAKRNVTVSRFSRDEISTFTVLRNAKCAEILNVSLSDSNLCIRSRYGCTKDYDRGAGVFLSEENTLIALISHGPERICETNKPSVTTRVSSYLEWIMNATGMQ